MATMNVSLPADLVDFVEGEVSRGGYSSSSEVVRDALRLLQHKALEQEKLAILRREVAIGLEDAAAGRFSPNTVDDIADEVRQELPGAGPLSSTKLRQRYTLEELTTGVTPDEAHASSTDVDWGADVGREIIDEE